jgi:ATP-dependent helicase HrpB
MKSFGLPVEEAVPALQKALAESDSAVLQAPPGAGKTTFVPLALLEARWLAGRSIVMLEPRRIAARAAAQRMAAMQGERVGETIGYRVRGDAKVSAATRVEILTEGLFTRRLQSDPALEGVGLVIFDEFHERSLDADLGLALALDLRAALRPDLKLLVMSATLDGGPIASLLGGAPIVTSEGRAFPVEVRYAPRKPQARLDDEITSLIRRAIVEETGSALVFLPGEAEIRQVASRLENAALSPAIDVAPLYGALPASEQDKAIAPSPPGHRKIVLATTIAETSLTIEGVRIVIDSGLKRAPRFDLASGMSRLATVKVSRASAEQRRGRAGRLEPGVCYRLWSEAEERGLAAFDTPEMREAELAPLALSLAQWGVSDASSLSWLDPPPPSAFAHAQTLLQNLEAIDEQGRITETGKAMATLPLHPRLAHMAIRGAALGLGALAAEIAGILSERDILTRAETVDLRLRLDAMRGDRDTGGGFLNRAALSRARDTAKQVKRLLKIDAGETADPAAAGEMLALAYPDRVAQRRDGLGRFLLSGSGGAKLPTTDPLAAAEFLAVAELGGGNMAEASIFLAAPLSREQMTAVLGESIRRSEIVAWNARDEAVQAVSQTKLGALVLEQKPLRNPAGEAMRAAMIEGIRGMGLASLPWTKSLATWRARVNFLRGVFGAEEWPDVTDSALTARLEEWLGPNLDGVSRRAHLATLDLYSVVTSLLPWAKAKTLDDLAPTYVEAPTGTRVPIDYEGEGGPSMAVRLQEVFGWVETPRIAGGRVSIVMHLLSPAQRPLAVTRDLENFWRNVYPQVRGEMRGRYPKHVWPDDPLTAAPTSRTKRAQAKNSNSKS